ncbi:MAG: YmaF family protein [Clostridiales bacterium]|nr:YmaF family protein [Clostridiales bacterium]
MSDFGRHEHECCGVTDRYCNHCHKIKDLKSCKLIFLEQGRNHVHYYYGKTSKDDKHRHNVCFYTGPAMPAACGCGHYHYYYGITSCDDGHVHYFRGITDIYGKNE